MQEEDWEQRSADPARGIEELVWGLCVLCGHENPFGWWMLFVWILPLRIDSLVGVFATL